MDVGGAHIAGFWRRIFAAVADGMIIALPALAVGNLFFDQLAAMGQNGRWIGYPVSLLYFGLLNSNFGNGQTLGKRLLGIRVVGASGNPIGVARSVLRASVLSLPWFLNGIDLGPFVPASVPNGPTLALAAASFVVFGISLASAYLYLFNRGTRQALHDLLVESFVVRAEPQGEVAPRVAPVHFAVAVAILGGSLALPLVPIRAVAPITESEPFSKLSQLQDELADDPDVDYVLATSEWQVFSSLQGGSSKTNYLTITVRLKSRHNDVQPIINRFARKVLELEPKILGQDKLRIIVSTGFDIGIAQYEDKRSDEGTLAEWREKLGPPPQTI